MSTLRWGCLSEPDLVVAAMVGDLGAFDELVRRYRPGAMVQAQQIVKSRDLAEDAVQDSFLAAYKALPSLGEPGAFRGWLGAIVRHRASRLLAGERPLHVSLDDVILAHMPSITTDLESHRMACALRAAVDALADEIVAVVRLYYFEDWTTVAISDFLGLPRTTVKWRLHAGRNQLRDALTPNWEELNEPRT